MEDKHKCMITAGGIVFIISVILILCSFSSISPVSYGLVCNNITKKCQMNKSYTGGLHFIGLVNYFVEFPAYQKTIEYSVNSRKAISGPLQSRTQDGFGLKLSLAFQYKLKQNEIGNLYKMSATKYEQTFDRIARDVIMQSAGQYNASEYWQNRSRIAHDMQTQLNNELQKAHANCISIQLLLIELPQQFEDKIVETQCEVQLRKQKEFERQATQVRQEINVMISNNDQQIKKISSSADAESYLLKQQATAKGKQLTISAESNVTKTMRTDLDMSDAKSLTKYLNYISLLNRQNVTILLGVNGNLMIKKKL